MACALSEMLSQKIGSRVDVGEVRIDLFNTLTIDSLAVYDRASVQMLVVGKAVGTVELLPILLNNKVRISSLKLFDAQAVLYRTDADAKANYQYAVDSLMPEDDCTQGLEIDLRSIILRNIAIRYDVHDEPVNGWLIDTNHIDIERFNANIVFCSMKADSIAVRVRSASVFTRNGMMLENLCGNIEPGGNGHYTIKIKSLSAKINDKLSGSLIDSRIMIVPSVDGKDDFSNRIAKLNLNSTLKLNDHSYDFSVVPIGEDDVVFAKRYDVNVTSKSTHSYINTKIPDWHEVGRSWLEALMADVDFNAHVVRTDVNNVLNVFGSAVSENRIFDAITFMDANGNIKVQDGGLAFRFEGKAKSDIFDVSAVVDAKENKATYNVNVAQAKIQLDNEESEGFAVHDAVIEGNLLFGNYDFANIFSLSNAQIVSDIIGNAKANIGIVSYNVNNHFITLNNLYLVANSSSPCNVDFVFGVNDPNADFEVKGYVDNYSNNAHFTANAGINHIKFSALGLQDVALPDIVAGSVEIDAQENNGNINDYIVRLNKFHVSRYSDYSEILLGDIVLTCRIVNDNKCYTLESDFVNGELTTDVGLAQLAKIVETQFYSALPSLSEHAITYNALSNHENSGYGMLKMTIKDLSLLSDYLSEDISLDKPLEIMFSTSGESKNTALTILAPSFDVAESCYKDVGIYFSNSDDTLGSVLMLTKYFDDVPVRIENHFSGSNDKLFTETLWKNLHNDGTYGSLKTETQLSRLQNHRVTAITQIQPSTLFISDTSWQISHAILEYGNDALRINDLIVSRGDQYVNINANFDKERKDLFVQLNDVEVEYLLGLVNFNPVDFGGKASGTIRNSVLNPNKEIEADFFVRDFLFNGAYLGSLTAKGGYDIDNNRMTIKAKTQAIYNDSTLIDGFVALDDKILDFRIKSEKINLQFLNKYIGGFIDDLEGNATGDLHIFGSLKNVQIEADEIVNYLKFRPKMLGVHYSIEDQLMSIRPDTIDFTGFIIRDPYGNEASVKGSVNHHYLYDFNYDIGFNLNDLLTINWDEQPTRAFWGKIFTDGYVNLRGNTGEVHLLGNISTVDGGGVDDGSSLFYSSGIYSGNEEGRDYIHFVVPDDTDILADNALSTDHIVLPDNITTDVWVDVKFDATPDLALNIVTDPLTRDYMILHGNGSMQLSYYNKGRFAINGIYSVNDGGYKLTIKDIIHKNFEIQPGGFLRFNGSLADADINLKGVHRVNSVSLSDLNVGASQSNSTVGVDCILNFTGKAAEPKVSFDIDFPRANNDENLLLKKFILTEEDRNMQAVYLLSIGRFYTYNYNEFSSANGGQNQSTVAMTSFLAGTLSGQINNILQDAFHITNWNFGTSIAAGRMGFNDMEVQGSLSGKMFNNRLLFNGNVGYRDQVTTYSNNFVGDFNLQWLLNKSGTISLKAYSETNDRYFTKSSLTTQGGGILFQRDFHRLRDFFNKK